MSNCVVIHCVFCILFLSKSHFELANCDVHTHGWPYLSTGPIFNEEVFHRNEPESGVKDYSFYYKYRAPSVNEAFEYVVLNSTAASTGSITANRAMDFDNDRVIEANANIRNASKFSVFIQIRGIVPNERLETYALPLIELVKPRSIAILCAAPVTSSRRRSNYRALELGKRIDGDFVVRFERYQFQGRYSYTLRFFDETVNINYVKLKIKSSTAIVFSNRVIFRAHNFAARIYTVDHTSFTAEMIIYGT